jgi:hypothetical protein
MTGSDIPRGEAHDETVSAADMELLAALGDVWREVDPVPAAVLEAARGAYAWRDIDAELAELILDSRLEEAAVRSLDGPRMLTFAADEVTVEVEVSVSAAGRDLVGQLLPPQPATVTIRCNGPDRVVAADELGRFSVAGLPAGPVSLLCRAGDVPLATSWITI